MISSPQNPKIKFFQSLKLSKKSRAAGLYLVEGVRLVEEACRVPDLLFQVFYSSRCQRNSRGKRLLKEISHAGISVFHISESVARVLSETQENQGIFAIMQRVESSVDHLLSEPGVSTVLLYGLQDPGNFGTIVRASEASGVTGVFFTRNGVDPFQSKAVRASMGSLFRMPVARIDGYEGLFSRCKEKGIQVMSTSDQSKTVFRDANLSIPTLLVFGQEGAGLPPGLIKKADLSVSVPMKSPVDSVNVAVTAGIILYEMAHQRGILEK